MFDKIKAKIKATLDGMKKQTKNALIASWIIPLMVALVVSALNWAVQCFSIVIIMGLKASSSDQIMYFIGALAPSLITIAVIPLYVQMEYKTNSAIKRRGWLIGLTGSYTVFYILYVIACACKKSSVFFWTIPLIGKNLSFEIFFIIVTFAYAVSMLACLGEPKSGGKQKPNAPTGSPRK